jgi:hypothetical protein
MIHYWQLRKLILCLTKHRLYTYTELITKFIVIYQRRTKKGIG